MYVYTYKHVGHCLQNKKKWSELNEVQHSDEVKITVS